MTWKLPQDAAVVLALFFDCVVERSGKEVGLVAIPGVNRTNGDTCSLGDVHQACAFKTALSNFFHSSIQNVVAGL